MKLRLDHLLIPVESDGMPAYIGAATAALKLDCAHVSIVRILNRSLDTRDHGQFYYDVSLAVDIAVPYDNTGNFPVYTERIRTAPAPVSTAIRPIIIGFGPAGMFAALELIERGLAPVIFERGKKIEDRAADIRRFITERTLNPESNIQFGEGGAGAYSDGKLFSRATNTPAITKVLDTFIRFGAPAEIAYVSKPHVGTDALCAIVAAIREYIIARGGEIQFGAKMTDLLVSGDTAVGVVINGEKEFRSPLIYLAVGHSSRETFAMIRDRGVALEQRPISVGVRIEHPVEIINEIRYSDKYRDFPGLGAASYSFTYTDKKARRGVYTFCMCPGGEVVNASSARGLLAINGMSYASRSSAFSNAAIVVTCRTDDYGSTDPLAGIAFQEDIERKAFAAAGGSWRVPAQNLTDFLAGRVSGRLNGNSVRIGTVVADLRGLFPPFVSRELSAAFARWRTAYPSFVSDHALLLGAETRTTCPVRIPRDGRYAAVTMKNLYPIGEGSGYSGGITSSAADAIRAVEHSLAGLNDVPGRAA